jgi:hypothetical protein
VLQRGPIQVVAEGHVMFNGMGRAIRVTVQVQDGCPILEFNHRWRVPFILESESS